MPIKNENRSNILWLEFKFFTAHIGKETCEGSTFNKVDILYEFIRDILLLERISKFVLLILINAMI